MDSFKKMKCPQHYLTPETQMLIAQAWKIHMLRRMIGVFATKNAGNIFKRHQAGIADIPPEDVISHGTSWSLNCPDIPEESVQVDFVEGSDIKCDCIDYPYDYVCKECKICIHMYTCSCKEVDEFPALICKHIHAVCQFGEGVVQKPDIKKHAHTPHRTPGHRWPNPMVFRLDITNYKKKGSPRGLVAVSSENIKVDKDLANGNYTLPPNWETDFYKDSIDQEKIRNEIKEELLKRKVEGDDMSILFSKKPRHDDSESEDDPADKLFQNLQQEKKWKEIKESLSKRKQEGDDLAILFSKKPRHDDSESEDDPADKLFKNIYQGRSISKFNIDPKNKCSLPYWIFFEKKTCEKSPTQTTKSLVTKNNLPENDSQQKGSGKVLEKCISYINNTIYTKATQSQLPQKDSKQSGTKKTCKKSPTQTTKSLVTKINLPENDSQQNGSGKVVEKCISYDKAKDLIIYHNKIYTKAAQSELSQKDSKQSGTKKVLIEQIDEENACFLRQSYNCGKLKK